MLAVDPDLPNLISSILKNLTLENPRDPYVLLVIDAIDLDLSNLGLEEVFMIDDQPTIEENDVLYLKPPPPPSPPPPPIFPPPSLVPDNQTCLTHPLTTIQNICLPLIMFLFLDDMMDFLTCIHGALLNFKPQILLLPMLLLSLLQDSQEELENGESIYENFGRDRQPNPKHQKIFFTILHYEFLGSPTHYTEVAREEFLDMKCCSFERKHLEKQFDRMLR